MTRGRHLRPRVRRLLLLLRRLSSFRSVSCARFPQHGRHFAKTRHPLVPQCRLIAPLCCLVAHRSGGRRLGARRRQRGLGRRRRGTRRRRGVGQLRTAAAARETRGQNDEDAAKHSS